MSKPEEYMDPHECSHKAFEHIKATEHRCVDCDETTHHPWAWAWDGDCAVCVEETPHPKWITKDSGTRQEYDSGMRRDLQTGKPRFDLCLAPVPYEDQLLTRWASLMERGAEKYGERNWQLAESYEEHDRFMASALRHMMQYMNGERDEDHAAAVLFNLMAAEYLKSKLKGYNDQDPSA